jgi:alpha-D-ribose 1-methylphosphonate 5-phosphate C-P lyase
MNETPMLFPIAPAEFWKQIRTIIEEVVTEKLNQQTLSQTTSHLPEKTLLKATDVCEIFQVSKPTLYEWMKQNKLKSFKIKSRRYFSKATLKL